MVPASARLLDRGRANFKKLKTMKTLTIDAPEKVAHQIQTEIGPLYNQAQSLCSQAFEIEVKEESDMRTQSLAREARLALRKLRTTAVNKCKEHKADALTTCRAIDETRRMVEDLFKPAEEHLMLQETYAERMQKERAEARRREREQLIVDAGGNPWDHNGFSEMADSVFGSLIEGIKREVARRKAEAEENAKRIKEQEARDRLERQRLAEENARLKAEAEQRERLAAIERTKLQAVERERQRIAERQQAALDEERRKREALEAKQRAEQARAEAEAKAKANAPVADKLKALKKSIFNPEFDNLPEDTHRQLATLIDVWNRGIDRIIQTL